MSELVAVTFPDPHKAAEVLASLRQMDDATARELRDAICVTRDEAGNLRIQQPAGPGADAQQVGFLLLLLRLLLLLPTVGSDTITLELAETGAGDRAGRAPRRRSQRRDDAERNTRSRTPPLRYRTYLLRVWEEQDGEAPDAAYRLSLEDAHTHRRRGFDRPERLLAHIQGLIDEMRQEVTEDAGSG